MSEKPTTDPLVPNHPFKLTVYVYRRPNLRDDNLEYERYMGITVLKDIFDHDKENDCESLFLSFPETWLNIIEQRCLYQRLAKYCKKLKEVTIKTHSVYIVQCTHRENLLIVHGNKSVRDICESDTGSLCEPMVGNLFNAKGLNVIGGEILVNK